MIGIEELKVQFDEVEKKYYAHLDSYRENKNISCRDFNALLFAMNDAYKILERGLLGKFSFEEDEEK